MTFNRQEVRNQTHTLQQSGKHLSTASVSQAEQTCPPGAPLPFHQTGFGGTTVKHQYFQYIPLSSETSVAEDPSPDHFLLFELGIIIFRLILMLLHNYKKDQDMIPMCCPSLKNSSFLTKPSFAAPHMPRGGRGCSHCSGLSPAS